MEMMERRSVSYGDPRPMLSDSTAPPHEGDVTIRHLVLDDPRDVFTNRYPKK